ncbi:hypothetical protein JW935_00035 [candidate division KSB1 bacterium]|nr:hypothetical protein [candidate division KSB1 bacterium]
MDKKVILAVICMLLIVIFTFFCFSKVYGQTGRFSLLNADTENRLQLTSEQSKRILQTAEKFLKEASVVRDALYLNEVELFIMLNQDKLNPAAVLKKRNKIYSLKNNLQDTATQYLLKVEAFLTPEQKVLLPYGALERLFLPWGLGAGVGRGPGGRFSRFSGWNNNSRYGMGHGSGCWWGHGLARGYGYRIYSGFGLGKGDYRNNRSGRGRNLYNN